MKRIINIILCFSLIAVMLLFAGCGSASYTVVAAANSVAITDAVATELSGDSIDEKLQYFLGVTDTDKNGSYGNRTTFTNTEELAGELLYEYAEQIYVSDDTVAVTDATDATDDAVAADDVDATDDAVEEKESVYSVSKQSFSFYYTSSSYETILMESQNIIAKKSSSVENAKTIIFGANYDNAYVEYSSSGDQVSEDLDDLGDTLGALNNGTGVAVVMALMDYYKDIDTGYNLEFIFFGGGAYSNYGAYYYVDELTGTEVENIEIMFNFNRIGGDYIYLYSEEVDTASNDFILEKADALTYDILEKPDNMPIINAQYIEKLPYCHWLLTSNHAYFMEENIVCASFTTGNYETSYTGDLEVDGQEMVSYTADDTYTVLVKNFPNYKSQMSQIALLAINTITDDNFSAAMAEASENYPTYDLSNTSFVLNIVIFGLIILLLIVMIFVVKHLDKKFVKPDMSKKKVKVAVFGMDYEEMGENDIYIDLKSAPKEPDPFDFDDESPFDSNQSNGNLTENKDKDDTDKNG